MATPERHRQRHGLRRALGARHAADRSSVGTDEGPDQELRRVRGSAEDALPLGQREGHRHTHQRRFAAHELPFAVDVDASLDLWCVALRLPPAAGTIAATSCEDVLRALLEDPLCGHRLESQQQIQRTDRDLRGCASDLLLHLPANLAGRQPFTFRPRHQIPFGNAARGGGATLLALAHEDTVVAELVRGLDGHGSQLLDRASGQRSAVTALDERAFHFEAHPGGAAADLEVHLRLGDDVLAAACFALHEPAGRLTRELDLIPRLPGRGPLRGGGPGPRQQRQGEDDGEFARAANPPFVEIRIRYCVQLLSFSSPRRWQPPGAGLFRPAPPAYERDYQRPGPRRQAGPEPATYRPVEKRFNKHKHMSPYANLTIFVSLKIQPSE